MHGKTGTKSVITKLWFFVFLLLGIFGCLLFVGQPKAANLLFFGRKETTYPGPIHVFYTSFPFASISIEIEEIIHEYPYQRYYDIDHVYFNQDTVYLHGYDKPIPIRERFFCVNNPTLDNEENIRDRVKEISALPDLQQRGYKHINLSTGFFIILGEVLSFLSICLLLLVLVVLYWLIIIRFSRTGLKISLARIMLTLLFSVFVLAVYGYIICYMTH